MRIRVRHRKEYQNIKIDPRWDDFLAFLEDMGERPEGTSLDRINVYGDYCKANCRWADATTQANNRTDNRYFTVNGKKITLSQLARMMNLHITTLTCYLDKRHHSLQEVLRRHGIYATVSE